MKPYIVYLPSGEITRTGQCSEASFHLQGELVLEGIADDATQYIQDGAVVNMPPKPGEFYVFDYSTKSWIPNTASADSAARSQRNLLLARSDWTQLPDVPLTTKNSWATYRQELRDVTSQSGYPFNVVWPIPPTA